MHKLRVYYIHVHTMFCCDMNLSSREHETNDWDPRSAGDWLCAVILDINCAGFTLLDC